MIKAPEPARPATTNQRPGNVLVRAAINAAAIDLFFKHGYEAATLRDVADGGHPAPTA